jgi:hypothetical protein
MATNKVIVPHVTTGTVLTPVGDITVLDAALCGALTETARKYAALIDETVLNLKRLPGAHPVIVPPDPKDVIEME